MIDVIKRERATGRTTELIRRCAKHRYALIVTANRIRAESVIRLAQKIGEQIPYPITFSEFINARFYGKNIDAFFIDDLDSCLTELARGVPIEAVVFQGEKETGEWINHRNDRGHNIADCDQCGETMQWYDPDSKPNFCPNCGVRMEGTK